MATKKPPPMKKARPTDSRKLVRIYCDVPSHIAEEFAVLAIRRGASKRALMAELIMSELSGK